MQRTFQLESMASQSTPAWHPHVPQALLPGLTLCDAAAQSSRFFQTRRTLAKLSRQMGPGVTGTFSQ